MSEGRCKPAPAGTVAVPQEISNFKLSEALNQALESVKTFA